MNSFWKFVGYTVGGLFVSCFLGIGALFLMGLFDLAEQYPSIFLWTPLVIIFFFFVAKSTYEEEITDRDRKISNIESEKSSLESKYEQDKQTLIEEQERQLKKEQIKAEVFESSLKERTSGFPTLMSYIEYFEELIDNAVAGTLLNKVRPAPRSADEIKEQSRRRREAEKKQRITTEIIEFYEQLEPSLIEYKNEEFGNLDEVLQEWTDEEQQDPVIYFVNKDEYRNLSATERNQLALDRYWKRHHSKWHIGIMYERFIGYIYEQNGYDVLYHGAKEGKRDLGRDLIAQKGNEFVVIQCKYWNQFRTVFENEIFQFFGTVFQYKHSNKSKKVKGVFYATTEVSDLARSFAKELGIELKEQYKMDRSYPCIKCNISQVDGSKIYHLPFDQQYDNVKIEPKKGEFYCTTTKEAEDKGFRRAWRWKG